VADSADKTPTVGRAPAAEGTGGTRKGGGEPLEPRRGKDYQGQHRQGPCQGLGGPCSPRGSAPPTPAPKPQLWLSQEGQGRGCGCRSHGPEWCAGGGVRSATRTRERCDVCFMSEVPTTSSDPDTSPQALLLVKLLL